MLTHDCIEQVRRRTGVSMMEAMHALSASEGHVEQAVDRLNDHSRSKNRTLIVDTRAQARQLASALVDAGIWFECETTSTVSWQFTVAVGAYAKLLALNAALLGEPANVALVSA